MSTLSVLLSVAMSMSNRMPPYPSFPFAFPSCRAQFLPPLIPLIGERAVLAVCGYLINNVAFVFAALYFYKLSATILKDPEVSLSASILFCFNPPLYFIHQCLSGFARSNGF